jgi:very-short-patch-repair endonuclease
MVNCQICNLQFKKITRTHLAVHGVTLSEYKTKFPNSKIISDDLRHAYGKKAREDNPMHNINSRKKVSDKLKGRKFSEETVARMKESANSRPSRTPHSEETKNKISQSNKAKRQEKIKDGWVPTNYAMSESAREANRQRMLGNTIWDHPNVHHNKGTKLNLSEDQRINRSKKRVEYLASNKSIKSGTKPELEFINYLETQNIKFIHQYPIHTDNGSWLMDFFLPSLNVFVEIDGEFWHSTLQQITRDKIKNKIAKELNIPLVRISTEELNFDHIYNDSNIIWQENYNKITQREHRIAIKDKNATK